jgi:hypothetical protein
MLLNLPVLKYNVWEPGSLTKDMLFDEEEFYDQVPFRAIYHALCAVTFQR